MTEQFKLSSAAMLLPDLNSKSNARRKQALRIVIANMTVNNPEMLSLFPSVISCISSNDVEVKRMCFLYIETYARARPDIANDALELLTRELQESDPLVRAMACRTISSVQTPAYVHKCIEACPRILSDNDALVRKSAAYAVAKLWAHDQKAVEEAGLLKQLNRLLSDKNPVVVSSAIQSLSDITTHTFNMALVIDWSTAIALGEMLPQCTEWAQSTTLTALTYFVPSNSEEATRLAKLIRPRLQHLNSSVVLGAVKVLLYLKNYGASVDLHELTAPLLTQLDRQPEIAYVILRSLLTIISAHPVRLDPRAFIYQESDPIYIKTAKLEVLVLLATSQNFQVTIRELIEYTGAGDAASRRAVSALGQVGIRVPEAISEILENILWLLQSSDNRLVQSAVIALQELVRRYPMTRFDEQLEALSRVYTVVIEDSEAYAALLWLIGHFPGKLACTGDILKNYSSNFDSLPLEVQLSGLTCSVKVFLLDTNATKEVTPEVLRRVSETAENPDLRDRAIMYWRLLAQDAQETLSIITAPLKPISADTGMLDDELLEELELDLGYLSSIYLKPAQRLFRLAKRRSLVNSPALIPRRRTSVALHNPTGKDSESGSSMAPKPPASRFLQRMNSLTSGELRPRAQSTINLRPVSESAPADENARLIDI